MKTATIDIYTPFGTSELCARVLYRGKQLAHFDKQSVLCWEALRAGLVAQCKCWATARGFTHYKIKG